MNSHRAAILAGLSLLALSGLLVACGAPQLSPDVSPEDRFEWAVERFEEGEYRAARRALRDFLLEQPLHPEADSAQLLLGKSHFRRGDYVRAAESFSRLFVNRPTSPLADDALLGECRSYWELSPRIERDQDYTRRAEETCQRLLDFFPDSPLRDEAGELRASARAKLAEKRYQVGKWYYDNRIYESANIYFEGILDRYPETPIVPEVLATLHDSYRRLGFDREAESVRERLLEDYADSEAAREIASDGSPGSR